VHQYEDLPAPGLRSGSGSRSAGDFGIGIPVEIGPRFM
jgi:hypothetical protein